MNEKYRLASSEIQIEEKNGQVLVLDPKEERIIILNYPASFILSNCNGYHSIEDIERKTIRNFNLQMTAKILDDINEIITQFVGLGLIVKVE